MESFFSFPNKIYKHIEKSWPNGGIHKIGLFYFQALIFIGKFAVNSNFSLNPGSGVTSSVKIFHLP